jgi:hypothetical protein
MSLSIANVIRVSILSALRGLANVNTSALALITDEEPLSGTYGNYGIYLDPTGVATDFGSTSETYRLANIVFAQNPNILTGKGYLVIIPRDQSAAAQPATILSQTNVNLTQLSATDYFLRATLDDGASTDYTIGDIDTTNLESILTSLNSTAITAAGLIFTISGEITSAQITLSSIATGASKNITIGLPSTADSGTDINTILDFPTAVKVNGADGGLETVKDCILRTYASINYFGVILNVKLTDALLTETALLIQALDKMLFVGSNLTADITGVFKDIKDAGYTHTRCTLYIASQSDALDFAAGYASRGLSVNFDGANTVSTMHLKEITGVTADESLTQTLLNSAITNGVDVYVDFGVPKIFTSGANSYFDAIYINLALKLRLQTAGFNYLAQTNTKIPQTEEGMNGLKGAYRKVLALFVTNGAFAPGAWNSSTTFGNPEDHIRNISEFGYFIYSIPIAQQAQSEREIRVAPLVQIAAKSSGAIHSSDVVAYIEA